MTNFGPLTARALSQGRNKGINKRSHKGRHKGRYKGMKQYFVCSITVKFFMWKCKFLASDGQGLFTRKK